MDRARFEKIMSKITEAATDHGLLIEAGFTGFQKAVLPATASQLQIDMQRMAFFAGALHLFTSIMNVLDPGGEPTEKDLLRMSQIACELERFGAQFTAKYTPTKGNA
jgi:hypothetical protein